MLSQQLIPKGQKVFFPNFVFILMRAAEKKPNEVVFKVPSVLNKFDIQQYLEKIYGLNVLDIQTINYLGKEKRAGRQMLRTTAWKKAIITLDHEFIHPPSNPPSEK